MAVRTNRTVGLKETFVPLSDAEIAGDALHVPFDKDKVKDAPNIEPEADHLTPDEEQRLYSYYQNLGWHPTRESKRAGVTETAERGRESHDDALGGAAAGR